VYYASYLYYRVIKAEKVVVVDSNTAFEKNTKKALLVLGDLS
jgi:hypothetical protein